MPHNRHDLGLGKEVPPMAYSNQPAQTQVAPETISGQQMRGYFKVSPARFRLLLGIDLVFTGLTCLIFLPIRNLLSSFATSVASLGQQSGNPLSSLLT